MMELDQLLGGRWGTPDLVCSRRPSLSGIITSLPLYREAERSKTQQSARTGARMLRILDDLFQSELCHVFAQFPSLVPCHRPLQRCFDLEPGLPSEFDSSLAGVQPENMILVHAGNRIANPGRALAPHVHKLGSDALDRPDVLITRSEIVGGGELCMLGEEFLSQHHVPLQRLEDVLPRSDGIRAPDQNRLSGTEPAHQVRYESVLGPVPSADDIAGARCRHGHMVLMHPLDWKE